MSHAPSPLIEHPSRRAIAGEVHARPYERLLAPVRASHLVMLTGEGTAADDREHLATLCRVFGAAPPAADALFFVAELGPLRLRWERHTEFAAYTLLRTDPFEAPFAETALTLAPADWLAGLPGALLVGVHVAVEGRERGLDEIRRLFDGNSLAGSRMVGAACAWTDFRLHDDGFGRMLVRDEGLSRGQTGRLLQRLLDVETYRMTALLAFPLARQTAPEIRALEQRLSEVVAACACPGADTPDRELLDELAQLSAEGERLATATGYRFAAARAYDALVRQRVAELREERLEQVQTVAEFMDRRMSPAMRTCEAAAGRIERFAEDVARAGSLLRTRVDIALEEQNADLLRSMDRRAQVQLRLQETVEGLSVVAISYYVLGLIGYAGKGLKASGVPVNPDVAVLIGLPLVVGLVWLGVRRLRRAVTGKGGH